MQNVHSTELRCLMWTKSDYVEKDDACMSKH